MSIIDKYFKYIFYVICCYNYKTWLFFNILFYFLRNKFINRNYHITNQRNNNTDSTQSYLLETDNIPLSFDEISDDIVKPDTIFIEFINEQTDFFIQKMMEIQMKKLKKIL